MADATQGIAIAGLQTLAIVIGILVNRARSNKLIAHIDDLIAHIDSQSSEGLTVLTRREES